MAAGALRVRFWRRCAFLLLALACGLYELGAWASDNTAYRAGFGLAAEINGLAVKLNLPLAVLGSC